MAVTPLTIIAARGMLKNEAFDINAKFFTDGNGDPGVLDLYKASSTIAEHRSMIATVRAAAGAGDNLVSAGVITLLSHICDPVPLITGRIAVPNYNNLPAEEDPVNVFDNRYITCEYFDEYIGQHAININGGPPNKPNNSLFISYVVSASSYTSTINEMVNGAVNGAALASNTFTSMDALASGNILAMCNPADDFGLDLIDSGSLYNFAKIELFGTPQSLLQQMSVVGILHVIEEELLAEGIDIELLEEGFNDEIQKPMTLLAQTRSYKVFLNTTGTQLSDVLSALEIKTPNINNLAELFDMRKIFRRSLNDIYSMDNGKLSLILTPGTTETNQWVDNLPTDLSLLTPFNIGKPNEALKIAFTQIKNIRGSTAAGLGEIAGLIESNGELPIVASQKQPIPREVTDYILEKFANGSGPDGTFTLTDVVGTHAGLPHIEYITTMNAALNAIDTSNYSLAFSNAANVANGTFEIETQSGIFPLETYAYTYTIPTGAGSTNSPYTTKDAALTAIYNDVQSYHSAVLASSIVTEATKAFNNSIDQITRELYTLRETSVQFLKTHNSIFNRDPALPGSAGSNEMSTITFASNLLMYGQKTDKGNFAEFLENSVKLDPTTGNITYGGEAVIGAMRDGRNQKKLGAAGIHPENIISTLPKVVVPGDKNYK